jgi:hypothetical protein
MAKSISTNFSLRINNKNQPKVIADSKISSGLTEEYFYTTTYKVDSIGIYLGEIKDFLAIQPKSPILIDFQRVDMIEPTQIYCSKLFINHGEMGKVWLRVVGEPVITTVWFSTNNLNLAGKFYIKVKTKDLRIREKQLELKNLDGIDFSLPVKQSVRFKGIRKKKIPSDGIPVITHFGENKLLVVNSK